jgi:hypothetical protein
VAQNAVPLMLGLDFINGLSDRGPEPKVARETLREQVSDRQIDIRIDFVEYKRADEHESSEN